MSFVGEFIAVDPGKAMGWAAFSRHGTLLQCGLTDGDRPSFPVGWARCLVIEVPHEGDGVASKADLYKLVERKTLAKVALRAERVEEVIPQRWKGSIPKMVRTPGGVGYPGLARTARKMTADDCRMFEQAIERGGGFTKKGKPRKLPESKAHNVLDAIGIGIWWAEVHGLRVDWASRPFSERPVMHQLPAASFPWGRKILGLAA